MIVEGRHIAITHHAERRVRQRLGLPRRAVYRAAIAAWEEGTARVHTRGRLRHYLDQQRIKGDPTDFVVHAEVVWVFRGEVLVTAWPLPGRLTP